MNFELPVIAPSILAADFTELGEQISKTTDAGVQWIHCDIMDGHFVPNISFGPGIVKAAVKAAPDAFIDSHLMIENPDQYIEDYVNAGSDLITIHYEACRHLHRSIQNIKKFQVMAGLALNPATPLSVVEPVLKDIDLLLIMSVNPGFAGQSFIESTHQKLQEAVRLREENDYSYLIQVDGGVGLKNIGEVVSSGAEVLVAGSAAFRAEDITARVTQLKELADKAVDGNE
jgi:ribulose-phosphate 3-epimerase